MLLLLGPQLHYDNILSMKVLDLWIMTSITLFQIFTNLLVVFCFEFKYNYWFGGFLEKKRPLQKSGNNILLFSLKKKNTNTDSDMELA